jgi:hypothetical protein
MMMVTMVVVLPLVMMVIANVKLQIPAPSASSPTLLIGDVCWLSAAGWLSAHVRQMLLLLLLLLEVTMVVVETKMTVMMMTATAKMATTTPATVLLKVSAMKKTAMVILPTSVANHVRCSRLLRRHRHHALVVVTLLDRPWQHSNICDTALTAAVGHALWIETLSASPRKSLGEVHHRSLCMLQVHSPPQALG